MCGNMIIHPQNFSLPYLVRLRPRNFNINIVNSLYFLNRGRRYDGAVCRDWL